eukprot:TRINITY_DN11654_c0_g1_i1.p1 TRINITY_DN11654_c0_g1~~TRINITY_DN11654_c0_g1_i1.p1  ORF type:complete len:320 (+),score=108.38 TRINITY_DN11654_c0_g1_i1:555-1514(+)
MSLNRDLLEDESVSINQNDSTLDDIDSFIDGTAKSSPPTTSEAVIEMSNLDQSRSTSESHENASGPAPFELDEEEADLQHALDSYDFDGTEDGASYAGNPDNWVIRNYEVTITKWYKDSWEIYKQHWIAFSLYSAIFIGLLFVPFVQYIVPPMCLGIFIAVTNKIRYTNVSSRLRYENFISGYYFLLPVVIIAILQAIIVFVGFMLLIIPGLYALFGLFYSTLIFIEFHHQKIGIFGAMRLSLKYYNKQIVGMSLFIGTNLFVVLSLFLGMKLLGIFGLFFCVGAIVAFPVSFISVAVSFKDIFGLDENKSLIQTIVLY